MKIGIVSDTHSIELPEKLLQDFRKVDFIIHAGDFCGIEDLQKLTKIQEVTAVHGNMDGRDIRQIFPRKQIFKIAAFRIGLFHGEGPATTILERVHSEFVKDKVDCIIFGHSHQPFNKTIDQILYFNPGSPNDRIGTPYCSYGILEVTNNKIVGKLIKVK